MQESFLHYLWKFKLYTGLSLALPDGSVVEVINPGNHNPDSGPDFFNAKIKIGGTVWAGDVEIHVKASDWYRHNHQTDKAYQTVILHVVAIHDADIFYPDGEPVPVMVLQSPAGLYEQFLYLMQNKGWVPCELYVNRIDDFTWLGWKESLVVERLKEKSEAMAERYQRNNHHWEETFYQSLAANFGFKTNAQPFEMLARSLPQSCLAKHKDQLNLLEAMFFGQSGLLPVDSNGEYVGQLISDYQHLAHKFGLTPLNGSIWKFSKLRPVNFPTLRISQFASLVHQSYALMSKVIETENLSGIEPLFEVKASPFWDTHFVFGHASKPMEKQLGTQAFQNIVINTLVPFLFFYAKVHNQPRYSDKALNWLNQLPPEQNKILRHWEQLGIKSSQAFDSQALIQLKNKYCNYRQCLNCRIGNQVIQHRF
ncbi:MAG TPA: DUF2851 domain-containing protein [Marinilabiliales bacterium]|nr:MAG: hypothetical protein A2W95_06955 [Bacteroidetes bacterium GWA2_40_14]OFX61565.1 MAG: hypothetical protein A2W84_10075 [Bacteroidetes bacterium GWC2_40_13]OFX73559.1 MAG: hypothetical protein A2W96_02730 [Bacteroidetes bacterium GWD2_40_43]OFX90766.1 MAG: hypothetical protein A2W97_03310 [Bacteroidetes bacterium GWE2_40_63]OFY20602.1 MAG: hypothetical protein A2W88_13525 [Bacteroidetes bacterium GWF2_40_13]OFZ24683.1 MAG: hypothetical protein A2437_03775 [Bacteroidetes bacterium RIFOXYC